MHDVTYFGIDLLRNLNPSRSKGMVAKRSKNKSTKTPQIIRIMGSVELKTPTVIEKKYYSVMTLLFSIRKVYKYVAIIGWLILL